MADSFNDQKRRPPLATIPKDTYDQAARIAQRQQQDAERRRPPIAIHPAPYLHANAWIPGQPLQQLQQRDVSSRSGTAPLTFAIEPEVPCLPRATSGSTTHKTRETTGSLSRLVGRDSPRKSEHDSTRDRQSRSTAPSRQSARSHQSAVAAQAQLEALDDEPTARAMVEARHERTLFKRTGQVPPTPIQETLADGEVFITTQDLRPACRKVSAAKEVERHEPAKSPKKKFKSMGMGFLKFGKQTLVAPLPSFPADMSSSKAAQVLGEAPRNPTIVQVRPIGPDTPCNTPTRAPRSNTLQSLPGGLLDPDSSTRSHHAEAANRTRADNRKAPPRNAGSPFEYDSIPPMPPKKDTPPGAKTIVTSPLRRTMPSDRLRETYDTQVDNRPMLQFGQFPAFALSPIPSRGFPADSPDMSPPYYKPNTAEEYRSLIAGVPLPFSNSATEADGYERDVHLQGSTGLDITHPDRRIDKHPFIRNREKAFKYDEPNPYGIRDAAQPFGGHDDEPFNSALYVLPSAHFSSSPESSSSPTGEAQKSVQNPALNRVSEKLGSHKEGNHKEGEGEYTLLPPRFYSPLDRSFPDFADGETPSKNSDRNRYLVTVDNRSNLSPLRKDPINGSIEMVYQGDASDIDPNSPTAKLLQSKNTDNGKPGEKSDKDTEITARVMEELHLGHDQEPVPGQNGNRLEPEQSSSRLTDILHSVTPRQEFNRRFSPNCPSAVPSPLHQMQVPTTPIQPSESLPSSGRQVPTVPQNIHDHFFMTNEHLDVMGRTTYDLIAAVSRKQNATWSENYQQLMTTLESQVGEVKTEIAIINEKTDNNLTQSHKLLTKLDVFLDAFKEDVMDSLAARDKEIVGVQQSMQDLTKSVLDLQKMFQAITEQKPSDSKVAHQHSNTGAFPASNSTTQPLQLPQPRSQASLAGYYGTMTESGRETQPPMSDHRHRGPVPDAQEPRAGYLNSVNPGFRDRPRDVSERVGYSNAGSYHFANGAPPNGYSTYSGYGYSPTASDHHYGYNQGHAK